MGAGGEAIYTVGSMVLSPTSSAAPGMRGAALEGSLNRNCLVTRQLPRVSRGRRRGGRENGDEEDGKGREEDRGRRKEGKEEKSRVTTREGSVWSSRVGLVCVSGACFGSRWWWDRPTLRERERSPPPRIINAQYLHESRHQVKSGLGRGSDRVRLGVVAQPSSRDHLPARCWCCGRN